MRGVEMEDVEFGAPPTRRPRTATPRATTRPRRGYFRGGGGAAAAAWSGRAL